LVIHSSIKSLFFLFIYLIRCFVTTMPNFWCVFDKMTNYNYVIRIQCFSTPKPFNIYFWHYGKNNFNIWFIYKTALHKLAVHSQSKIVATVYVRLLINIFSKVNLVTFDVFLDSFIGMCLFSIKLEIIHGSDKILN